MQSNIHHKGDKVNHYLYRGEERHTKAIRKAEGAEYTYREEYGVRGE